MKKNLMMNFFAKKFGLGFPRAAAMTKFKIRKEGIRRVLVVKKKKKQKRSSHLLNLPQEIILNILSRLPFQSILNCRRVCKSLRNPLSFHDNNTYFTDMHLHHQSGQFRCDNLFLHRHHHDNNIINNFNHDTKTSFVFVGRDRSLYYAEYDEYNVQSYSEYKKMNIPLPNDVWYVVGSCNGLICLSVNHNDLDLIVDPVYICNPIAREFLHLPKLIFNNEHENSFTAYGFGYHPSTNEYKVVRIYYDVEPGKDCTEAVGQLQVYTLGSGVGWRSKGEISHWISHFTPGVLFNGALYWIASEVECEGYIVAFDLADEEFRRFPMPRYSISERLGLSIWVLGGCLCLVDSVMYSKANLWFLKKKKKKITTSSHEDGNEKKNYLYESWSWRKEFITLRFGFEPVSGIEKPFAINRRGEILHLYEDSHIICSDLIINAKPPGLLGKLPERPDYIHGFVMISHVNSFVSLKALGENAVVIV